MSNASRVLVPEAWDNRGYQHKRAVIKRVVSVVVDPGKWDSKRYVVTYRGEMHEVVPLVMNWTKYGNPIHFQMVDNPRKVEANARMGQVGSEE